MRLLSEQTATEAHIKSADELITLFFINFVELYGVDSQSFNFHTMRHLCEQFRRNGPLWLFSAFCFESANHNLLSAVQGTIKEPEAIVQQFIKHQAAINCTTINQAEKYLKGLTTVDDETLRFCDNKNISSFFLGLSIKVVNVLARYPIPDLTITWENA